MADIIFKFYRGSATPFFGAFFSTLKERYFLLLVCCFQLCFLTFIGCFSLFLVGSALLFSLFFFGAFLFSFLGFWGFVFCWFALSKIVLMQMLDP